MSVRSRLASPFYGRNRRKLLKMEQLESRQLLAATVGHHLFYNHSSFDGNDSSAGPNDDAAIATDKTALLPNQVAEAVHYSSFVHGINGVMIDIAGLSDPNQLDLTDFEFRVGRHNDVDSWATAPSPSSISVREGQGSGGADRVTLTWPNGSITNSWLQVRLQSNDNTGLPYDDVFYFGSAIGDIGTSFGAIAANATDFQAARLNLRDSANPAPIDSPYDFNRDMLIDEDDLTIVRVNTSNLSQLVPLAAPPTDYLELSGMSPTNGETSVRVSRDIHVDFNEALDPDSITAESLTIAAADQALTGSLRLSSNQQRITLTLDEPIPTSTAVRLAIHGDLLRGADGSGVDADSDGLPGGRRLIEFRTAALTPIPGTSISGYVYDSNNTLPAEAMSIDIPAGDIYFDPQGTGTQSIEMTRAMFLPGTGTAVDNPRQHINLISSYLDGGAIYGDDTYRANSLRELNGSGRLKVSTGPDGSLLPLNNADTLGANTLEVANDGIGPDHELFAAGDIRASENPNLISIQTLLVREHNRKAAELRAAAPNLSGNAIYQQAKAWTTAVVQHITYQQWLPALLGPGAIADYTGYESNADPSIAAAFSTAAFRFGHSMATSQVDRLDASGQALEGGPLDLHHAFFTSEPILADGISPYLRGMIANLANELDTQVIDGLRNFLFGPPGAGGLDLVSINIDRGRDLGLASYNQARIDFGLTAATDFNDITSDASLATALENAYGSVDKLDLWIGGLAENHVNGGTVGELFATIIADQFERTRNADRFWYENGRFTAEVLAEIRAMDIATLIQLNTDITGLSGSLFTSGTVNSGPAAGGLPAAAAPTTFARPGGFGNHEADPFRGSSNQALMRNDTIDFADGISEPSGADRPGPREISNAVSGQTSTAANAAGLTNLFLIWGQFVDHDLSKTPGQDPSAGRNIPLENLTIRVDGLPDISTTTDANGFFFLDNVPAGKFFVDFDTSTVTSAPEGFQYAGPEKPFVTVAGEPSDLKEDGQPHNIYLPLYKVDEVTSITSGQMTLGQFGESSLEVLAEIMPEVPREEWENNFRIEVPADSVFFDDGTPAEEIRLFALDKQRIPTPLPEGIETSMVFSVEAGGATQFDAPSRMTFPNVDDLAPGEVRPIYSYDHDLGEWLITGQAVVSDDGSVLETEEGGVNTLGWKVVGDNPATHGRSTPMAPASDRPGEQPPDNCDESGIALNAAGLSLFALGTAAAIGGAPIAATAAAIAGFGVGVASLADTIGQGDVPADLGLGVTGGINEAIGSMAASRGGFGGKLFGAIFKGVGKLSGAISAAINAPLLAVDIFHCVSGTSKVSLVQKVNNPTEAYFDGLSNRLMVAQAVANQLIIDQLSARVDLRPDSIIASDDGRIVVIQLDGSLAIDSLTNQPARIPIEELADPRATDIEFLRPIVDALDSAMADVIGYIDSNTELLNQATLEYSAALQTISSFPLPELANVDSTIFYAIRDVTSQEVVQRGVVHGGLGVEYELPSDRAFVVAFTDPVSLRYGQTIVNASLAQLAEVSGLQQYIDIPLLGMLDPEALDSDGDGLPDVIEDVIGTGVSVADSDMDGLSDFAELDQGLNPLDGIGFPTGIVGALPLAGEANDVFIAGDLTQATRQTAYLATGSHGLAIVDATEFNRPVLLGQLDLPGQASSVVVNQQQSLAFVAAGSAGAHVVDISDPQSPTLLQTISHVGKVTQLEVVDETILLASSLITTLNASTGEVISSELLPSADGPITDLQFSGGVLYAVSGNSKLHTLSVDDLLLVELDAIDIPEPPVRRVQPADMQIFVADGVAYVSNGYEIDRVAATRPLERGGYVTFDVSNPSDISLISNIDTGDNQAGNLQTVLNGSGLALVAAGFRGLEVHGSDDPSLTYDLITAFPTPGNARGVAVVGGMAFVADGTAGLQVINYRDFDALGNPPTISVATDAIDIDPDTAGIQVQEGTTVRITPDLTDDVQVRSASLLVGGQVIQRELTFPYDLQLVVANLPEGVDSQSLAVQVRATDTGGNAITSSPIVLEVHPDVFAPEVDSIHPLDGVEQIEGQRTVTLTFSEPIDPQTLAGGITLTSAVGTTFVPEGVIVRGGDRLLQITYPILPLGDYDLTLGTAGVTDRAGNPLAAEFVSTFSIVEDLDPGDTLATATDLGVLTTFEIDETVNIPDQLGNPDPADVFRFLVAEESRLSISLTEVTDFYADISVGRDLDGDGNFNLDFDEVIMSDYASPNRTIDEIEDLVAGEYFVVVTPDHFTDMPAYRLELDLASLPITTPLDPGATLPTALDLGTLVPNSPVVHQEVVSVGDTYDVYRFTLTEPAVFTSTLSGVNEDVGMTLVADLDQNGEIDFFEDLFEGRSTGDEVVRSDTLIAGEYHLQVYRWNNVDNSAYTIQFETAAATTTTPSDPGATLATALNLEMSIDSDTIDYREIVGGYDPADLYRFEVTGESRLSVSLTEATDFYADIRVGRDLNSDGDLDFDEIILSDYASPNRSVEEIEDLVPGEYFVEVTPDHYTDTPAYRLMLGLTDLTITTPTDPGATLSMALDLGTLVPGSPVLHQEVVSIGDTYDVYRFTLTEPAVLTGTLSGMNEEVGMTLVADLNQDGEVDFNDELFEGRSTGADLVRSDTLVPGEYHLQVYRWNNDDNSAYTIQLETVAATTTTLSDPGSTLATALDLETLNDSETIDYREIVGGYDTGDVYRFEVTQESRVSIDLTEVTDNYARLEFGHDLNANGELDSNERLLSSYASANSSLNEIEDLVLGEYFVVITPWYDYSTPAYRLALSIANLPVTTTSDPGSSLSTAYDLGALTPGSSITHQEVVSASDDLDVYRFTINEPAVMTGTLSGMNEDVGMTLVADLNQDGEVDFNEDLFSGSSSSADVIRSDTLVAGEYHLLVDRDNYNDNSAYTVQLETVTATTTTLSDPGSTLATALDLETLNDSETIDYREIVGGYDTGDVYRFEVTQESRVSIDLTEVTDNYARIRFGSDLNANGQLDSNEWLLNSYASPNSPLNEIEDLVAGEYFVVITPWYDYSTPAYRLSLAIEELAQLQSSSKSTQPKHDDLSDDAHFVDEVFSDLYDDSEFESYAY